MATTTDKTEASHSNRKDSPSAEAPPVKVVSPTPRKKKAMRAYLALLGLAGAVVAIYFIHGYVTRNQVSTDDAQVDADVVPIAPRVGGVVLHMKVEDNQRVEGPTKDKPGTLIAEIDPADYVARVAAAQADLEAATAQAEAADAQVEIVKSTSSGNLSTAQAQLRGTDASVRTAEAQIQVAEAAVARTKAELAKAEGDLARAKKLHDAGAVPGQALETAQTTRDSAKAAVDAASANLRAARDQVSLSQSRVLEAKGRLEENTPIKQKVTAATAAARLAHARVDGAKAALEIAKLQLGYTQIRAPTDGFVSRLAVHEGQTVQPGMTLLMIVPATTYVVANFKETQTERIRPGDPVDVSVDALGDTLHGKVASLAPGTGARFSMMPPDNATGNFVKVVQRVPVKIVWEPGQDLSALRAGLSVEVKVHLQH